MNDIHTRASDYHADQNRKKAELVDKQLEALRSLNSPLPKRPDGPKPPVRQKPMFQPQNPVGGVGRSPTPAQSLGDLANIIKNPPLSNARTTIARPAVPTATQGSNSNANAKNGSSFNPFSSRAGNFNPTKSTGGATQATPSKPPPASMRKGPIRMEIPLGDDDDEPTMTEGMTIGEIMKRQKESGNRDDQDKRSKQWGVDMSRFQK